MNKVPKITVSELRKIVDKARFEVQSLNAGFVAGKCLSEYLCLIPAKYELDFMEVERIVREIATPYKLLELMKCSECLNDWEELHGMFNKIIKAVSSKFEEKKREDLKEMNETDRILHEVKKILKGQIIFRDFAKDGVDDPRFSYYYAERELYYIMDKKTSAFYILGARSPQQALDCIKKRLRED